MRLALVRLSAATWALLLPAGAWAAQPALPAGDPQPATTAQPTQPPGSPDAAPATPTQPQATGPAAGPAPADPAPAADPATPATDPETTMGISAGASVDADTADADVSSEGVSAGEGDPDDPGNVRGRREPMMPTHRGGIGLFHTTLPDVGGRFTFRFRLHTDFFRKEAFIYEGTAGPDTHARVRGGVAIGFTPFKWGEVFFSVNNSANRNAREQPGRQEADAIFALGDIDFGFKGAHRFLKNGIGVGGQLGVGLLSGDSRLLTSNVNFWVDGLFAVDVRYLTQKQFPFRFTTNLGWMLDNSLRVADYAAITDPVSREVARFSLGGNHNRLRMRYAVDFPVRLGKDRQFGIDPLLEWSWDVSTTEEPAFARADAEASPLPRSSQWLTLGLRANVWSGLHVSAGADIGMVSPNFEFGPPTPPWQVILGLGGSFDPRPVVKEVEVESDTPPPASTPGVEGRILGQVVDPQGTPVPDARVTFPGLTSGVILTDASGTFTSYRFPAGTVTVQVSVGADVTKEAVAEIVDGQDTNLTIQLDSAATPSTGIVNGTFTDAAGSPVTVSMRVVGQGVDESFASTAGGLILLELYEGDYTATLSAPGFLDKQITFTVPASGEISINEALERDAPPDTPLVSGAGKSIRLKEKIRYDGNDVAASSHGVLDQLATFLNAHPEYKVIQVGVHTDDRGAAQKRSADRAEAVRTYLTGKGVSPDRVKARGYGASKPVAVNLTSQGRAKNNRTTISVLDME